jgi:hypothetical protein
MCIGSAYVHSVAVAAKGGGGLEGPYAAQGRQIVTPRQHTQLLELVRGERGQVQAVGARQPRQCHVIDIAVLVHLEENLPPPRPHPPHTQWPMGTTAVAAPQRVQARHHRHPLIITTAGLCRESVCLCKAACVYACVCACVYVGVYVGGWEERWVAHPLAPKGEHVRVLRDDGRDCACAEQVGNLRVGLVRCHHIHHPFRPQRLPSRERQTDRQVGRTPLGASA